MPVRIGKTARPAWATAANCGGCDRVTGVEQNGSWRQQRKSRSEAGTEDEDAGAGVGEVQEGIKGTEWHSDCLRDRPGGEGKLVNFPEAVTREVAGLLGS